MAPSSTRSWLFDPAPDNRGYGGRPDSAAVDQQGNYFVALFEGRRICKLAPDGTVLAEWATPVQCATMPMRVDVPGLPVNFFVD